MSIRRYRYSTDEDYGYGPQIVASDVPLNEEIEFYVSHALTPNLFYIQLKQNEEEFDSVFSCHMQLCSDFYKFSKPPQPGTICAALFALDGNWYRACVINNNVSTGLFTVLYFDYGNVGDVQLDDLRMLDYCFAQKPSFACLVSVCNLIPINQHWSEEEIESVRTFFEENSNSIYGTVTKARRFPHRRIVKLSLQSQSFFDWISTSLAFKNPNSIEWASYYYFQNQDDIKGYDLVPNYRINGGFFIPDTKENSSHLHGKVDSVISSCQRNSLQVKTEKTLKENNSDFSDRPSIANSEEEAEATFQEERPLSFDDLKFPEISDFVSVCGVRKPLSQPLQVHKFAFPCLLLSGKDSHPDEFFVLPLSHLDFSYSLHTAINQAYSLCTNSQLLMRFMDETPEFNEGDLFCVEVPQYADRKFRFFRGILLERQDSNPPEESSTTESKSPIAANDFFAQLMREGLEANKKRNEKLQVKEKVTWKCYLMDIGVFVSGIEECYLHPMAPQFASIPALSIACKLGAIQSKDKAGWSKEAVDKFQQLVEISDGVLSLSFCDDLPVYNELVQVLVDCELCPKEEDGLICINFELLKDFAEWKEEMAEEICQQETPQSLSLDSLPSSDTNIVERATQIMKDTHLRSKIESSQRNLLPRVCEYFRIRNFCRYGDSCHFKHTKLTDEELLMQLDETPSFLPLEENLIILDEDKIKSLYCPLYNDEIYPVIVHDVLTDFTVAASIEMTESLDHLKTENDSKFASKLNELTYQLSMRYSFEPLRDPNRIPFPLNSMICARIDDGEMFARARVLESIDDKQMQIELVDYGKVVIIPIVCAHPLDEEYIENVPFYGLKMYLYNLSPMCDDPPDCGLETIFNGNHYAALIKQTTLEGNTEVILFNVMETGEIINVNDRLLEEGFCEERNYADDDDHFE